MPKKNECNQIKPVVDDQFWFNLSGKMVTESYENINTFAGKLQTFMLWLWGAFTTYSTLYLGLKDIEYPIYIILLTVLASCSIIIVYFLTVYVQIPKVDTFDPKIPTQIQNVYKTKLTVKISLLNKTLVATIISLVLVTCALLFMSLYGKKEHENLKYEFRTSVDQIKGNQFVSLMARVENTKKVNIQILDSNNTITGSFIALPTELGIIQASIPLLKTDKMYSIILEWNDTNSTQVKLIKKISGK
jgi:hypothetical protein